MLVLSCLTALAVHAESRVIVSPEAGWPQFRGPARDGVSTETGLLQSWPEGGPAQLWTFSGLGKGYSSPIITEKGIFITGDVGEDCVIYALTRGGELRWKATNGRAWTAAWPGARAACTYADGRLYHMNGHGRTVCLDPETGAELWAVDVLERFQGSEIKWGLSECVLVDGGLVYVTPGGPIAFMAALDAATGETVWQGPPLRFEKSYEFGGKELDPPAMAYDNTGYASPLLFEMDGRRILARTSGQHLVCVDAADGALLWTHPIYARYEVIGAIPVFQEGNLLFAAPDDFGGRMFSMSLSPEGLRVRELWETAIDNCHSALVAVDGRLYGSGYRRLRDWVCIDAKTGETLYSREGLAQGVCAYADNRIYALSENGTAELLEPTATVFETRGSLVLPGGKRKDVWAHPAICEGRLYLRDHDTLYCFNIKAE